MNNNNNTDTIFLRAIEDVKETINNENLGVTDITVNFSDRLRTIPEVSIIGRDELGQVIRTSRITLSLYNNKSVVYDKWHDGYDSFLTKEDYLQHLSKKKQYYNSMMPYNTNRDNTDDVIEEDGLTFSVDINIDHVLEEYTKGCNTQDESDNITEGDKVCNDVDDITIEDMHNVRMYMKVELSNGNELIVECKGTLEEVMNMFEHINDGVVEDDKVELWLDNQKVFLL